MSTTEILLAQLAEAQTKIEELELKNQTKKIEIKVSEKGCVQINGIRKFPVTFYKNELEQIFNMKNELEDFMNINKDKLKSK